MAATHEQFVQQVQGFEKERAALVEQLYKAKGEEKDKAPSVVLHQIYEKDAQVKKAVEQGYLTQNFLKKKVSENVWRIVHNVYEGGQNTKGFEVQYVHPTPVKDKDFWEVRIDDIGEKWWQKNHDQWFQNFDMGMGLINMTSQTGKNREDFDFDVGCVSDIRRIVNFQLDDKKQFFDCPDRVWYRGDIMRFEIEGSKMHVYRNGNTHKYGSFTFNDGQEYRFFCGMNNHFGKVTLSYNQAFGNSDAQLKFPKEDVRCFVTSHNEGSPRYAKGVSKGGQEIMRDGMVARKMKEDGRRFINFRPGYESGAYDAKYDGNFVLEEILPGRLLRNRFPMSGNMVTITRPSSNKEWFRVHVQSLVNEWQGTFQGTNQQWQERRNEFFMHGEKNFLYLSPPFSMFQMDDKLMAGTKCHRMSNDIYTTLKHKEKDSNQCPAVLFLGGDRSQSIGSISGAFRAYEDLCCIYFDSRFDFRDPNHSTHPLVDGSPMFLLFQKNLREAVKRWCKMPQEERIKDENRKMSEAIEFLRATPEGDSYWKRLQGDEQNDEYGYRGFNWMRDQAKMQSHRFAFCGMRHWDFQDPHYGQYKQGQDASWNEYTHSQADSNYGAYSHFNWSEHGHAFPRNNDHMQGTRPGSPLVGLFHHLLRLDECMYPEAMIRSEGVQKVFPRIIEQFRRTFEEKYVAEKDAADPKGYWCPPIMVSWNADSIDPEDMPCTQFQERDGLSHEECMQFCDEIAYTQKMVMFETVEFNPDLWQGYRDEPYRWTVSEWENQACSREPKEPEDKNKWRFDRQNSTHLLQDMILRAFKKDAKKHY